MTMVTAAEISSDPKQPSRLEKKKNMPAPLKEKEWVVTRGRLSR